MNQYTDPTRQFAARDLHLVAMCYHVLGFVTLICIFAPASYLVYVGTLTVQPDQSRSQAVSAGIQMLLAGLGCLLLVLLAGTSIWVGRLLAARRQYNLAFFLAFGLALVSIPFGTLLGVFAVVVLSRPAVRDLFFS